MGRLSTFLFGALVGAGLLHLATNYYVVRAPDQVHLIPKVNARLSQPYVDIRAFTLGDWADHQELALAITNAGKSHLLGNSAANSFNQALDNFQLQIPQPSPQ